MNKKGINVGGKRGEGKSCKVSFFEYTENGRKRAIE